MDRRTLILCAGAPMLLNAGCKNSPEVFSFSLVMKALVSGKELTAESIFADRASIPFLQTRFNPAAPWIVEVKGATPIIQHPRLGVLCGLMVDAAWHMGPRRNVLDIPLDVGEPLDEYIPPMLGLKIEKRVHANPKQVLARALNQSHDTQLHSLISPYLAWIKDPNDLASCIISDENQIEQDSGGLVERVKFYLSASHHRPTSTINGHGQWINQLRLNGVGPYKIGRRHLVLEDWST